MLRSYYEKVVLSLFDGISVGKVALDEIVGFEYDYYSSEIDKDAILNIGNIITKHCSYW